MHHMHNEILFNIEHDQLASEAEVYFERLRAAGIEPGTSSRKSLMSWLRTDRHSRGVTSRPRPA
jgi:hypothetical protein